jgi:hypothetical protein
MTGQKFSPSYEKKKIFLGICGDALCAYLMPPPSFLCGSLHCKDKIPKFRNKYSRKGISGSQSQNFHIYVSVSDLYIPTIGLPILLEEICRLILGLYKSLTDT